MATCNQQLVAIALVSGLVSVICLAMAITMFIAQFGLGVPAEVVCP